MRVSKPQCHDQENALNLCRAHTRFVHTRVINARTPERHDGLAVDTNERITNHWNLEP